MMEQQARSLDIPTPYALVSVLGFVAGFLETEVNAREVSVRALKRLRKSSVEAIRRAVVETVVPMTRTPPATPCAHVIYDEQASKALDRAIGSLASNATNSLDDACDLLPLHIRRLFFMILLMLRQAGMRGCNAKYVLRFLL